MTKGPNSIDGIELSDEALDAVSGGEVRIPSTHAEIDAAWNAIQAKADAGDLNAAATMAYNMGLIPFAFNRNNEYYFAS